MTAPALSVIICTHNPRADYLARTLEGLRRQSLEPREWELLVIDNRSVPPVSERIDLSWHPGARCIPEPNLGLTPARLCGIEHARGEILVFVDDDNVLDRDYLAGAVRLMTELPDLGAAGGEIVGEFEVEPPSWMGTRELEMIGVKPLADDCFAGDDQDYGSFPIGAGLVIRAGIAAVYARTLQQETARAGLDRCGASLVSGGDSDMVQTALHSGSRVGRFACLSLTHLIPAVRVTLDYHLRLAEGIEYSNVLLFALQGKTYGDWLPRRGVRYWLRRCLASFRRRSAAEMLAEAAERGIRRGLRAVGSRG